MPRSHKDPEWTNIVCVKAVPPEVPGSKSGLLSSLRHRAAPALGVQRRPASFWLDQSSAPGSWAGPELGGASTGRGIPWEGLPVGQEFPVGEELPVGEGHLWRRSFPWSGEGSHQDQPFCSQPLRWLPGTHGGFNPTSVTSQLCDPGNMLGISR